MESSWLTNRIGHCLIRYLARECEAEKLILGARARSINLKANQGRSRFDNKGWLGSISITRWQLGGVTFASEPLEFVFDCFVCYFCEYSNRKTRTWLSMITTNEYKQWTVAALRKLRLKAEHKHRNKEWNNWKVTRLSNIISRPSWYYKALYPEGKSFWIVLYFSILNAKMFYLLSACS